MSEYLKKMDRLKLFQVTSWMYVLFVVVPWPFVAVADPEVPQTREQVLESFRQAVESAPDLIVTDRKYYFHWASPNRIRALQGKKLTQNMFSYVLGKSGPAGNSYDWHGPGFYVSAYPFQEEFYGENFLVAYNPKATGQRYLYESEFKFSEATGKNWERTFQRVGIPNALDSPEVQSILKAVNVKSMKGPRPPNIPAVITYNFKFSGPSDDLELISPRSFLKMISQDPSWLKEDKEFAGQLKQALQKVGDQESIAKLDSLVTVPKMSLGQRFIDPEHWEAATAASERKLPNGKAMPAGTQPFEVYGKDAFAAWENAVAEVDKGSANRLPTLQDYLAIHKTAYNYPGATFKSYYANKIQGLPRGPAQQKAQGYFQRGEFETLAKEFGWDPPLGQLRTSGNLVLPGIRTSEAGGSIPFEAADIEKLKRNSFLTVKEHLSTTGNKEFTVFFPPGKEVSAYQEMLFEDLHKGYASLASSGISKNSAEYERRATKLAADFYQGLVSTHGVWDGSGRSAKLARDWALQYMGLPAPAFTPSNDLELSADDLAQQLRKGIQAARGPSGAVKPPVPVFSCQKAFGAFGD